MPGTAPDIYAYTDFRAYLKDAYADRHGQDRRFSHRFIAEKLGDKSPSFLNKVIQEGRRLVPAQIDKLVQLFHLDASQSRYFRILYLYSTAADRSERDLYLDQLIALNHTPRREVTRDLYEYYSKWYYPAVRVALSVLDVKDDYKMLGARIRPRITTRQAEEAVLLLRKLDMLQLDEQGFLRPIDRALFAKDRFRNEFLQQYRHQCLELAGKALETTDPSETSQFFTASIGVSQDAYKRILDKYNEFRAEVRAIVHKDPLPATRVVQLQTQIFPLVEEA